MKKLRLALIALFVSLFAIGPGCNRHTMHLLADVAFTAVAVAALVAVHDAHYHNHYCGHRYVYHEGHPVYFYEDRWEYYEERDGNWYYYPDGVPHQRQHYRY